MYNIPSEEKTYVVYIFVDDYRNREFITYTLESFKMTVDDVIQNGRPTLNDSDFVDNGNILDFVSDGTTNYVP